MSQTKPDSLSFISPLLAVEDVARAADFYCKAFGFSALDIVYEQENAVHAELSYKGCTVMLGIHKQECWNVMTPKNSDMRCPVLPYVYVEDVDSFFDHATKNGAATIFPPKTETWGDKVCRLRDPDGYDWSFASKAL